MRVIAGLVKGRKLSAFKGSTIRPTSDRARESLFNILGDKVNDSSFLDLFAGSGAIGIEALSRNAKSVIFVENHITSITLIKKNLGKCGFSESNNQHIEIIRTSALLYLESTGKQFDIVFLDPPYKTDLAEKNLDCLSKKNLLKPNGVIILEHHFKKAIEKESSGLQYVKEKKIGDTIFSFFSKH